MPYLLQIDKAALKAFKKLPFEVRDRLIEKSQILTTNIRN